MEVDWADAFGKKLRAMSWCGDNEVVLRFEGGIKLYFYVKDNRLMVEALVDESLTIEE